MRNKYLSSKHYQNFTEASPFYVTFKKNSSISGLIELIFLSQQFYHFALQRMSNINVQDKCKVKLNIVLKLLNIHIFFV